MQPIRFLVKQWVVDYAKGYNHNNDEKDTRTVSISGGTFQAEQGAVEVYTTEGNKVPEPVHHRRNLQL